MDVLKEFNCLETALFGAITAIAPGPDSSIKSVTKGISRAIRGRARSNSYHSSRAQKRQKLKRNKGLKSIRIAIAATVAAKITQNAIKGANIGGDESGCN